MNNIVRVVNPDFLKPFRSILVYETNKVSSECAQSSGVYHLYQEYLEFTDINFAAFT